MGHQQVLIKLDNELHLGLDRKKRPISLTSAVSDHLEIEKSEGLPGFYVIPRKSGVIIRVTGTARKVNVGNMIDRLSEELNLQQSELSFNLRPLST